MSGEIPVAVANVDDGLEHTNVGGLSFRWEYSVRFRAWNAGVVEVDQRHGDVSAARSLVHSITRRRSCLFCVRSFELSFLYYLQQ